MPLMFPAWAPPQPNRICELAQDIGLGAAVVVAVVLAVPLVRLGVRKEGLRWLSGLPLAAALLICLLVLVVAGWNWPVADDWSMAVEARRVGVGGSVVAAYQTWTGRWCSTFLAAWCGGVVPPVAAVRVVAVLMSAGVVAGSWWVLAAALRSARLSAAPAFVCATLWMVAMEWPGHGLFWFSAVVNYSCGLCLVLLLLGMALRVERMPPRVALLLAGSAGLLLGGLTETFAVAVGAWCVAALVRGWIRRTPTRWLWSLALAGLAGLLINLLAPGNWQRAAVLAEQDGFSNGGRVGFTLSAWVAFAAGELLSWLGQPVLVIGVLVALPWCAVLARRCGTASCVVGAGRPVGHAVGGAAGRHLPIVRDH